MTSQIRDTRIVYRDPLAILKLAQFEFGKRVGDNQLVTCPFHQGDGTPSCSVELVKGVFTCHGCKKDGRFEELVAQKLVKSTDRAACEAVRRLFKDFLEEINVKIIDPLRVENYHRILMSDEHSLQMSALAELKGITRETVERFSIGWSGERYSLPVYDQHKNVVNIRYRSLDPSVERKCINHPSHGTPVRLYPWESLSGTDDQWVIITEGEMKALLLCQLGFRAITGTGGAGKWLPEWSVWFKGKRVAILYDVDAAGKAGALAVARHLIRSAAEVKVCRLPLDEGQHPKGDVTDWYMESPQETFVDLVKGLIDSTPPYSYTLSQGAKIDTSLPIMPLGSLIEVNDPANHGRHIQVDAVIAAEETDTFRVPIGWKIVCQEDQPFCDDCPVSQLKKHEIKPEPWCHTDLLKLVDTPEQYQMIELKIRTGIPKLCQAHTIDLTEHVNVQAIEVIPDLDNKSKDRDTVVSAFYFQKDVTDNRELHGSLHTIKGFPVSDPKSGRLVLVVYDATPAKESLDRFVVDDAMRERLTIFQPKEWTVEGIEAKLRHIYDDLSVNVIHVYGRHDMLAVYDVCYHSLLKIPFNQREVKGWIDGLVIGDSGQGKSIAFEAMREFYGLGDMAVGASCTRAGLLGSVQESARKRRFIYKWGKIPLNDRRLVCIEESSGLPFEIIQSLRDPRSSGRHEDTKAKLTRVSTRTRLVWIANPRNNRSMGEHPYGISAMRELIGDDADIRRFDIACFVVRGEVETAHIRNGKAAVAHTYKQELCQSLVLWAWSRPVDCVEFEPFAVERCRHHAVEMSRKYTSRMPLVMDTEQDEKLARIAAALAARTFSTRDDDAEVLLVRACHVDAAAALLDRLYSSPSCNYHLYSSRVKEEESVEDNAEVDKAMRKLLNAKSTADFMLEVGSFTGRDLSNVSGLTQIDADRLTGLLLRSRAVRPDPKLTNGYIKTPGFTAMLKRISSVAKNESAEKRYAKDDF